MILPVQELLFKFEKGAFLQDWPGSDGTVFKPKSLTCYSYTVRQRQYAAIIKKELGNGLQLVRQDLMELFKQYQGTIDDGKQSASPSTATNSDPKTSSGADGEDLRTTIESVLSHPKCNVDAIYDAVLGLLFDKTGSRKPTLNDSAGSTALVPAQREFFETCLDGNEFHRFVVEYLNAFFPTSLQLL